jgi:DNA-binding NtrC family response regulator
VLVVEDDDALRKLTVQMLKENGYEPLEAPGKNEAVKILSGKTPAFSIIFANIAPGGRQDNELVADFKALNPAAHLVFTGGQTEGKRDPKLINDHGCRFIQKPYSIETVLKIFKELLPARV